MSWHLFSRRYVAGQARMVALVFCVVAAVAFPLLVLAFRALDDEPTLAPVILGFCVTSAAFGASCACLVALTRITRCARARIDSSFPNRTAITDVVLKGRDLELSPDDRVLATKYAVALLPYLAFQHAQLVLLCGGLLASQLAVAMADSDGPDPMVVAAGVLLAVAAVGSLALWIVQSGRVRRFLAENQRLLGAPVT